mmetsp:Transcript_32041/g.46184  ORF Transcript_32041/g.46184 Transcript_32041/m.46184 type:complete len:176 (-) Transcript_32041:243-770(-)|eukprot:CAMPEP_0170082762 /NCGR_PEP_ID=MMETSP0019_2-20121128/18250_1 /TAXON_ID=98059 /ORGANISM="Dinobryon sp., Strain UTEXLB2267" /LENGTH=175 /DNA_ID=CAMNT_0010297757 /DNA_START=1 /DNA_END=528 /DNA_ORIENTATION=+
MNSYFNLRCPFHVFVAGVLTTSAIVYASSFSASHFQRSGLSSASKSKALSPTSLSSEIQRYDVETRYSDAVKYKDIVFTSGQVSSGVGDIIKQAKEALESVDRALALAGTDKSSLLDVTIWLADIENDYKGMNSVYDEWISQDGIQAPCRACIQAKLFSPSHLIEIKVIAAARMP